MAGPAMLWVNVLEKELLPGPCNYRVLFKAAMAGLCFLMHTLTPDLLSCVCLRDKANLLRHRVSRREVCMETCL